MSNWDNEFIFEAYKKQNRPLEESVSVLLKNDLILANHIYNEWSMSDWHSGVKKVAQKAANVGGFLMNKVKKYIVEPLLGKNREVLNKLSKVKTKEELAELLKTYGQDEAFHLINNNAITNAERRVQNNESYVGFWDLILLEASKIDEGLKSNIIEFGNSLGEGGAEVFKDLAETNISLDEVEGNENLKRLCKFVARLIEDDNEKLEYITKLAVVLSNLGDALQPTDDDYDKKYGTQIDKIISGNYFRSATEKQIVDAIKEDSKGTSNETKQELATGKPKALKATKAVSKLDVKTKRAASTLQRISDVMPTNPQDVQTVINLIAKPEKLQGEAKNSLQQAIKRGGRQAVADVVELAGKISTGMIAPPALNILDLLIQRYGEFIVTLGDEFKSSKDAKEKNINRGEKRAYDEVKFFALTFGTFKKLTNFLTKIESKKIKTKNSEQQAYIDYLNSDGKKFLDAIKIIASKVFAKDNISNGEQAPKLINGELEVVAFERKLQPKDVVNIFKLINLFFQRFTPQTKKLTLAFQQTPATNAEQKRETTVGSLMAERYGIKNINQAVEILNKSSDPREIGKAIMFVTFENNVNEKVDDEKFDSVELSLSKKMNQWVEQLKKTKSASKLREDCIRKGYDKDVIEALVKALARLTKDPNIDIGEVSGGKSKESDAIEIDAMVDKISKGDEELKKDILNALSSAEERIQQAKDEEERQVRIQELREFLLSKGFATEENISHVMAALAHMSRGGLVRPHDQFSAESPQQKVNSTERLKTKVKQMGSTSFFKIAYDIIMDRQKMMSLGIGMAILFICFLLFGAPFLALLYVAIKAKQAEGEQQVEAEDQEAEQNEQPSAVDNLKKTVIDKGKEVVDKTANAVIDYIKPNPKTP